MMMGTLIVNGFLCTDFLLVGRLVVRVLGTLVINGLLDFNLFLVVRLETGTVLTLNGVNLCLV